MVTELKQTVHQCAWCKSLMIDGVRIEDIPDFTPESHGICLVCAASMEMQILDDYSD